MTFNARSAPGTAQSSVLFGPGVIEPTNAKPTSPSSSLISRAASLDTPCTAVDNGRQGAVLYDPCMSSPLRLPSALRLSGQDDTVEHAAVLGDRGQRQ